MLFKTSQFVFINIPNLTLFCFLDNISYPATNIITPNALIIEIINPSLSPEFDK